MFLKLFYCLYYPCQLLRQLAAILWSKSSKHTVTTFTLTGYEVRHYSVSLFAKKNNNILPNVKCISSSLGDTEEFTVLCVFNTWRITAGEFHTSSSWTWSVWSEYPGSPRHCTCGNCRYNTVTTSRLNARICKNLFQAFRHQISTPTFASGVWRKFEKNIQNLLLVICMPCGARLLSIAPFFQPFDILLDVGVCLRCSSDTYCSLFQKEREGERGGERGREGAGLLIERVGLSCTQTPNKRGAEFPQVLNAGN